MLQVKLKIEMEILFGEKYKKKEALVKIKFFQRFSNTTNRTLTRTTTRVLRFSVKLFPRRA
jgi:hypothetical protein